MAKDSTVTCVEQSRALFAIPSEYMTSFHCCCDKLTIPVKYIDAPKERTTRVARSVYKTYCAASDDFLPSTPSNLESGDVNSIAFSGLLIVAAPKIWNPDEN